MVDPPKAVGRQVQRSIAPAGVDPMCTAGSGYRRDRFAMARWDGERIAAVAASYLGSANSGGGGMRGIAGGAQGDGEGEGEDHEGGEARRFGEGTKRVPQGNLRVGARSHERLAILYRPVGM